jgi:hypothetical protein
MIKKTFFSCVLSLILAMFFFGTSISANINFSGTPSTPFVSSTPAVARGNNNIVIFKFKLTTTVGDTNLLNISLENLGAINRTSGISDFKLYLDSDSNGEIGTLDLLDTELSISDPFNTPTVSINLSTPQLISTSNIQTFFLTMDLSNSSTPIEDSDNMKFKITDINTGDGTSTGQTSPQTPSINLSGISNVQHDTTVSTSVIITGQTNIPVLKFSLQLEGDTVHKNDLSETKRVQFSFTNAASNFVTQNASNGIVKASLYYVPHDMNNNINGIINEPSSYRITEVCNTCTNKFTSKNTLDFQFTPRETTIGNSSNGTMYSAFGEASTSENFLITYDLGSDTIITSNASMSIKPSQFTILGDDSNFINSTSLYPIQPYELNTYIPETFIKIGGLSLERIESAVPLNSVFGKNTRTPILKFKLRAIHTALTLNRVTILNAYSTTGPGTIPFKTNGESNEGIKQIDLYYDNDRNNSFSYSDTLVGSVPKGDQTSVARLSITGNGLLISEYDEGASSGYTNDNSAVFFTVYHFGGLGLSGTTTKTAIARLGNVITSVNINGQAHSIKLPGISETSPAIASPEATITLGETNVSIEKITDISLDTIVQGHIKAPMLKIDLL